MITILKFIWSALSRHIWVGIWNALKWVGSAIGRATTYVLDRPALQRDLLFLGVVGFGVLSVHECRLKRGYADRYEAAQKHADSLILETNQLTRDIAAARENTYKLQLRNDTLKKRDSLSVSRLSDAQRTAINRQLLSELKP